MTDTKCPFCGSGKRFIPTGTVSYKRSGTYEADTTVCCKAQSQNIQFKEKRYGAQGPDLDEISKI